MITVEDVKHIAKLSKLEFSETEIQNICKDMDSIIDYVNTLSKIDTSNVQNNLKTIDISTLRADEIKPSLSQADATLNAPAKLGGGFGVPQVIE